MRQVSIAIALLSAAALAVLIGGVEACSSSSDDTAAGDGGGPGAGGEGGDADGAGGGGGGGGEGGSKVDGGGSSDGATSSDAPHDGPTSESGTSCMGLALTCAGNKDCCAANLVPGNAGTADTFNRSNDSSYPAKVSDFTLDVYEVTVGRFRRFVDAGKGTQASPPAAGDGAHPTIAASGWLTAFTSQLPADTAALKTSLKCNAAYPSWADAPGTAESNPINCVTWFEAFAFCAWDGGRLPTETEWNYAAAGGNEQRLYAWGSAIDHTHASYDCSGRGQGQCMFSDMKPVGSFSPAGDGRWGQADLTGNVWEYTLDYSAVPYRLTTCNDCADLQAPGTGYRTFRGGSFANEGFNEVTSLRLERSPQIADYDVGIRCARAIAH